MAVLWCQRWDHGSCIWVAVGKLDVTSNVVRRSALIDGWQDWLCGVARVWLREHVPKLVLSLCGGVGPFEGIVDEIYKFEKLSR